MKKRTGILIACAVSAIVIGSMAFTLVENKKVIDSKSMPKVAEPEVAVTVSRAEMRETGEKLKLVGTAKPNKEVMIPSETAGKIVQVNFKLGDYVAEGSVIAKVDDTYKRLALETAQLNYNKYKEDYERYRMLREGDAVTEVQLRDMKMGLENADLQIQNARKQLEDTNIRAPFGGVITSKNTELGAFVNTGTPIAGIADISQLKVSLAVSEMNAYNLRKGQDVNITTDVYPGEIFKGKITNISPQGSNSHTYPVEIMIPNHGKNPLKAGTYLNAEVNMSKPEPVLMIPRDAIVSSVKDPSVYVIRDSKAGLTKIVTGQDYESFVEVISGLKEGDQIVTNGQINLSDGNRVAVNKNYEL